MLTTHKINDGLGGDDIFSRPRIFGQESVLRTRRGTMYRILPGTLA